MPTTILLVDDNRETLKLYARALKKNVKPKELYSALQQTGMSALKIEEADTVPSALQKLKAQQYDILVVDLKIPGTTGEEMGGLEVISESMRLDPLRPIIVITGFGTVELARKTLLQGVFDFIEKSITAVDDLIKSVKKAIEIQNDKTVRSGNPFTPRTGVEPTVFGGRTKELEFFENKLQRVLRTGFCEHFLVLGNWGIGKSTLLKEYKKICQSRGYLASIVPLEPLQPASNLVESARSLIEGILRGLPYSVDRLKKLSNFFNSVGVSVFGTGFQFSKDTSRKEMSPQAFLHDSLLNLWQDLNIKTEAFVILLDDLENFISVSEIFMTLKQTLSMDSIAKTKILLGMATTPMSWLEVTSIKKHHPLSRYFLSRVELDSLSKYELYETITRSLAGTGVSFSDRIMARIFEHTEGHPFEMQLLSYHLFNNQLSRRVEIEVWDKALQATLYDMGIAIFDHWLKKASSNERKILLLIASSKQALSLKKIQGMAKEKNLMFSPLDVSKYLQRLAEKKLINKIDRGMYTVSDRMFRAYLCAIHN